MSRARTSGSSGRSANGRYDAASAQAVELVGLKVDVIVAEFTPAAQAAQRATQTIPIVMAPAGDPVAVGLVLDLAHPGGNVTGFSNLSAELAGKLPRRTPEGRALREGREGSCEVVTWGNASLVATGATTLTPPAQRRQMSVRPRS